MVNLGSDRFIRQVSVGHCGTWPALGWVLVRCRLQSSQHGCTQLSLHCLLKLSGFRIHRIDKDGRN